MDIIYFLDTTTNFMGGSVVLVIYIGRHTESPAFLAILATRKELTRDQGLNRSSDPNRRMPSSVDTDAWYPKSSRARVMSK